MINARQSLIHAIADCRYNIIASYLDDDYVHADLPKGLFMKKLEEMFELIESWEGEESIITVQKDVDLRDYAKEHGYCDPVFFQVNDSYFILDIYETTSGKYCIDDCAQRFEDTELSNSFELSIYKDERLSFVPDENYLKIKNILQENLFDEDGAFKTIFWSTDRLVKWVEENRSFYEQINEEYSEYKELSPYGAFFEVLEEISHGYSNYNKIKQGIAAYKDVDYQDAEQNYHWSNEYGRGFQVVKSLDYEVETKYEGYFVVSKIPTHYFPFKGYEQLIPFFNLFRVSYCVSLPHRGKLFGESLQNLSDVDDDHDDESYFN